MNYIKGYNYELQIKYYIINQLNKKAYLWHETPETILINSGIIGSHNEHRLKRIFNKQNPLSDTGIDIIQIEDNNLCSLVQCKNGYKKGLTFTDLAGFMCWMSSLINLEGYVYYTNKLSTNIKCLPNPNNRIKYIKQIYNENIKLEENKIIKPYNYQLDAVNNFNNNFTNRGILSLPCGTGKTLISYLCAKKYKQVIILSPLKQFAIQNLNRFIEYSCNFKDVIYNNTLLVDSDGERNIEEIKKFINSNDSFLISSTFCSIDVIYESLKYMNNPLFIIDEFHNLSKNNITNEEDYFYKLLNSDHKLLFVSATPKVYDLEDEDYKLDLFGSIIYNMSFTEAIDKKYITDYKIWLPSIHEDNNQLDTELSIYQIDFIIKSKCKYFYSCLLNNGSRKCIIYCIDTKEINEIINAMNSLNNFYYLDYEISQITSINTEKERNKILHNFTNNNNKIQLLFSVRILDECIDIPSCDSIYITYPSKSKIRTIQRLCRCIRIDKNNKFKIGNIYIWCNEYDDILETLSGIKEYDLFFKNKIMVNQTNFYGNSESIEFNNDTKLIENYIIGIKEYNWNYKLKLVEKYIIENNKTPSQHDKNKEIKQLGKWLDTQKQNYKKNEKIMKDETIRNQWETFINKYKEYFLDNNEIWLNNLKLVEKYIIENNKTPSYAHKNKEIKQLGCWLLNQKQNYKNNDYIMKYENIRK